jgi:hypothetical protein
MSGYTPLPGHAGYDHPLTLDQIATAAAALITEARAAGLATPFSLTCHDYGTPTIALYLPSYEIRDIRAALEAWASTYRTRVEIKPGVAPGRVHGQLTFERDGITCEISAVITSPPEPGDEAGYVPEHARDTDDTDDSAA